MSVGLTDDATREQKGNIYPEFNQPWEILRPEESISWLKGDTLDIWPNDGAHLEETKLANFETVSKESYLPPSLVSRVQLFNVLTSAAVIRTACEEIKKIKL